MHCKNHTLLSTRQFRSVKQEVTRVSIRLSRGQIAPEHFCTLWVVHKFIDFALSQRAESLTISLHVGCIDLNFAGNWSKRCSWVVFSSCNLALS